MSSQNYYLVTALPPLEKIGSRPPLSGRKLMEMVAECDGPTELLETIFLSDDLILRDAMLAGEIDQASPSVLTLTQVRDEEPLPAFLAAKSDSAASDRQITDTVWSAYFHNAACVARRAGSPFLTAWVGYEVALRNALTEARAKALQLAAEDYLIATDLAASDESFEELLSAWTSAPDPLAGLEVLDKARWEWVDCHDAYFSFADDELAAYAAKLMLLARWERIDSARVNEPEHPTAGEDP